MVVIHNLSGVGKALFVALVVAIAGFLQCHFCCAQQHGCYKCVQINVRKCTLIEHGMFYILPGWLKQTMF